MHCNIWRHGNLGISHVWSKHTISDNSKYATQLIFFQSGTMDNSMYFCAFWFFFFFLLMNYGLKFIYMCVIFTGYQPLHKISFCMHWVFIYKVDDISYFSWTAFVFLKPVYICFADESIGPQYRGVATRKNFWHFLVFYSSKDRISHFYRVCCISSSILWYVTYSLVRYQVAISCSNMNEIPFLSCRSCDVFDWFSP